MVNKIHVEGSDASVTIEFDNGYESMDEIVSYLIIPAFRAMGFADKTVDQYMLDVKKHSSFPGQVRGLMSGVDKEVYSELLENDLPSLAGMFKDQFEKTFGS